MIVDEAAKILRMSYVDLEFHPEKRHLMKTAFTIRDAREKTAEVLKAQEEQKAKL